MDGEICGGAASRAIDFSRRDPLGQGGDDRLHHCILDSEDIFQVPVVAFRPDVIARCGVDQLSGHPDPIAAPAHTSFDHVAHAELPADLGNVDRVSTKTKGGIARDHEQHVEAGLGG